MADGYRRAVVDDVQRRRGSFDENAEGYHRGRPGYPERVYEILAERCGLKPDCRVLEVGPGTGQATARLLDLGADVVGVEPGGNLAAKLRSTLAESRLRVIEADIARVSLPENAFDLAVSATAFHWVDASGALPVIAGALRPGGALAVWWTVFGDPGRTTEFRAKLDSLYYRRLREGWAPPDEIPPPLRVGERVAELEHGGLFGPVDVETLHWNHHLTAARARDLFATFPNIRALARDRRESFLDDIAALVDDCGGEVLDPYVTVVYTTRRTDAG